MKSEIKGFYLFAGIALGVGLMQASVGNLGWAGFDLLGFFAFIVGADILERHP